MSELICVSAEVSVIGAKHNECERPFGVKALRIAITVINFYKDIWEVGALRQLSNGKVKDRLHDIRKIAVKTLRDKLQMHKNKERKRKTTVKIKNIMGEVNYELVFKPIDPRCGSKGVDGQVYCRIFQDREAFHTEDGAQSAQVGSFAQYPKSEASEATDRDCPRNDGAGLWPSVYIAFGGDLVSRELPNGDLCIPREAILQALSHLCTLANSQQQPFRNQGFPGPDLSIYEIVGSRRIGRIAHITFPSANKNRF